MDPVTHTLFGMAIGEAVFRPRLGRRAVTVSAWAANLPDIDVLILATGDPAAVVLRRSFGHSLFLLPLWIAGLGWIFKKKYPDMEYRDLLAVISLNAAGHLLFDLINSFGVQLFWPFSLMRPELAIIFILDIALTGVLAAPHLTRLSKVWRPRLTTSSRTALAVVGLYLLGAFASRARAVAMLAQEAKGGFQYVFPEPFGAHRWRGVVKDEGSWRVYLINAALGTTERRLTLPNDENTPPALAARRTRLSGRLESFFKAPAWETKQGRDGKWTATIRDLRFMTLLVPRAEPFSFTFDVGPDGAAVPRGTKIW
jgi:membrane-bound metal-dependent hydrolase YbcI (DUF457 family)